MHAQRSTVPRVHCGPTHCPRPGRQQTSPPRLRVQLFLPDEERSWVHQQRAQLQRVWRRALLVLSSVSVRNGEHELGIQHAADVLSSEPFDETACQALMRAHAAAGNRAEALRVYANCRKLFRDELGAEPSERTAAVFLSILRG
jgi:DNA-binding SARP family transcriptional activator